VTTLPAHLALILRALPGDEVALEHAYGRSSPRICTRRSSAAATPNAATGSWTPALAITAQADGLALVPTGADELPAGTEVAYLRLQRF